MTKIWRGLPCRKFKRTRIDFAHSGVAYILLEISGKIETKLICKTGTIERAVQNLAFT